MFKFRCLLALVFLGSITLVPVASWANAIHPDPPSICDAVAGNLVKNCGFETLDFSDWAVKLAASGSFLSLLFPPTMLEHSGCCAAAFGATGSTDDSISQVLSTTAGRSFDLSFFLENFNDAPPGGADFSASWDGTKVFSASTTFFGYTQFSFVVPGTGSDTLQFAGRHEIGNAAYFLDDIVVIPTPEPSTLSLFGLGLLLGGALLCSPGKSLRLFVRQFRARISRYLCINFPKRDERTVKRTLWLVPALAVAVLALLSPSARADEVFYYTSLSGTIQKVDVTTGTNVAVVSGLSGPDGLIFSDPNTLVFTQEFPGQLQSGPVTGSPVTTLISSGLLGPQDLALDPSRTTVLVLDTGNSRLLRESLSGGSPTTLATFGPPGPSGVAYDASGHLFVVVANTIEQLNPATGAFIKSLGLPAGGNDLAYDPFSKALWVAASGAGGVIKVDTGLTTATLFSCLNPPVCGRFDGLESGGNGNIYLANEIGFIDAYNITGNTFSSVVSALGIDDLAPVIGSGSPTPTPEPGTFITLGTGLLGVWGVVRRKLAS